MRDDPKRQTARGPGDLIIVVPARVSSRRFPAKALASLNGEPLVAHVVRRALEADVGPVVVATDAPEIADAVAQLCVVVVDPTPARTGTDRVARTVASLLSEASWVINLQGDEPCFPPEALRQIVASLPEQVAPIVSAAIPMSASERRADPDVVEVLIDADGNASDFLREPPPGFSDGWHEHVGVYAFRAEALAEFAALPTALAERRRRLEQLRALEAGWPIAIEVLQRWRDRPWPGVNRPSNLREAEDYLGGHHPNEPALHPCRTSRPNTSS